MPITVLPERVVPGRRLGRRLNHDARSRAYRYRGTPTDLVSVQHLPSIPCLDQGNVGSCVPNTGTELVATDLYAAALAAGGLSLSDLTESWAQVLYHDLTVADDYPGTWRPDDTGSDGLTLGKVLVARGLASGYQHAMDVGAFLAALQTRAVPVGMTWRAGCDNPNADGLIRWAGTVRGGHELLACGYDKDRQWVLLQNHWGADWGIGGRCWISLADITAALASDGDATIIIPATHPAPTPTPTPAGDVDAALAVAFHKWRPSVRSTTSAAGRLAAAGDAWAAAHHL